MGQWNLQHLMEIGAELMEQLKHRDELIEASGVQNWNEQGVWLIWWQQERENDHCLLK